MNPTIKRKWVTALTSGRYKQGHGILKRLIDERGYEYCCLGVLREVLGTKDGWTKGTLTTSELEKAGITDSLQGEFIGFNDSDRMPFPLIAGFIQENL